MSSVSARYVLRPASTAVAFWVGAVVLAVVVGTPLVTGDWRLFLFVLPPALLLAWLLWIVLYRPAVHYDSDGAVIVNIGRIHQVPWSQVASLRQGVNLIFTLESGRFINAWGVPAPRRPGNVMSNFDRRSRIPYDVDRNVEVLEAFRASAAPSPHPVSQRWDTVPLAVGGVLLIVVALEFALRL